ncbi:MAG: DUF4494 family protein [Bacteroidales bacterium]
MNRFEVVVKYVAISEKTGKEEKISPILLVHTETFGNAEEQAYDWLEVNTKGSGFVDSIKRSNIDSIRVEKTDEDFFFVADMLFLEATKTIKTKVLFNDTSLGGAEAQVAALMSDDQYYDEVEGIKKTKIIEILNLT